MRQLAESGGTAGTAARDAAAARRFWVAAAAILALGAFLRFQQIGIQWLTDDEWHAVHKLLAGDGYLPILLSFGEADYSIPLTALYRLLADSVGLTEWRMRLPMLLGGTALPLLAMLWARRRLGGREALVFGFLLAVSPLLVNFSRYARPYILTLLLACLAVWALAAWARGGGWRRAGVYLACAWLAGWLHLIMAPFMLAMPLPLLLGRRAGPGASPPGRPAVLVVAALAALGTAALTLPPLLHDLYAISAKTGSDLPTPATLAGVWHIWFGTGSAAVVLGGMVLAVLGARGVRAAFPLELAMWSWGLAAIVAAELAMRPAWVSAPITFARYLLPALPLLLLLVAAGIGRLTRPLPGGTGRWAAGLAGLAFLLGTPHAALLQRPNNFTLHSWHQGDYRTGHNPVRRELAGHAEPSPFWRRFAGMEPGSVRIAVAGHAFFPSNHLVYPLHQPVHRQRLYNLQTGGACGPDRLGEAFPRQGIRLANAVSLALPGDLEDNRIDWIVLDYRLTPPESPATPVWQVKYLRDCKTYLVARFGRPAHEDAGLAAFRPRPGPP